MYDELVSFIFQHGHDALPKPKPEVEKEIDWFASHKRLLVVRNKGRIVGICGFVVTTSVENMVANKWPEDDPDGKYLFIRFIVIHKRARFLGVLGTMMNIGLKLFDNLQYLVYERKSKLHIVTIKDFSIKEVTNGRR